MKLREITTANLTLLLAPWRETGSARHPLKEAT